MEHGTDDGTSTVRPESVLGAEAEAEAEFIGDDTDDGSDSDEDPDNQMMLALSEMGRQKSAAGDSEGALKSLHKCLNSVETVGATRHFGRITLQREVMDLIISIYTTKEDWAQAQAMCRRKLRIEERAPSRNLSQHIADLLKLAEVTMRKGDLDEAVLQARRAFKQSGKSKRPDDAASCLVLLSELSKKSGDEIEAEAYTLLLSRIGGNSKIVERPFPMLAPSISSVVAVQSTSAPESNVLPSENLSGVENNHKSAAPPLQASAPSTSSEIALPSVEASAREAQSAGTSSEAALMRQNAKSGSEKALNTTDSQKPPPALRDRAKSASSTPSTLVATTTEPDIGSKSPEVHECTQSIKVVVTGSGPKTKFVLAMTTGTYPGEYIPTVFDNYHMERTIHGRKLSIGFWDTAGQEDYDRLRPLSYPQTDVFLLVFSVVSPSSFDLVPSKWYPELNYHAPGVPIILIGLNVDLRDDPEVIASLGQRKLSPVTREKGEEMRTWIGAQAYLECDAKTRKGLSEVPEQIALAIGIRPRASSKSKKDNSWSASYWRKLVPSRPASMPRS